MLLTWGEAVDELSRRNGGRRYGDGFEVSLGDALAKPPGAKGAYKDGDLVMGSQLLLSGENNYREKVRAQNTFDLLSESKGRPFEAISATLNAALKAGRSDTIVSTSLDAGSSHDALKSWSCTRAPNLENWGKIVR